MYGIEYLQISFFALLSIFLALLIEETLNINDTEINDLVLPVTMKVTVFLGVLLS